MIRIFFLFILLTNISFSNLDTAETIIEIRANILPLNFLIVEIDKVDFGDIVKGGKVEKTENLRVYGRKDLDIRVELDNEYSLLNTVDPVNKITAILLNHNTVTGRIHKINQNIDGEEGQIYIPLDLQLNVPASSKSGEYFGSSVIRVTIDS